jgi:hypothetical protein
MATTGLIKTRTFVFSLVVLLSGVALGVGLSGPTRSTPDTGPPQTASDAASQRRDPRPEQEQRLVESLKTLPHAQQNAAVQGFNTGTLNGTYAFSSSGGDSSDVYGDFTRAVVRLGTWQFDGSGRFVRVRTAFSSTGGSEASLSFPGTYSVDASGNIAFRFASGVNCGGIVAESGAGFVFVCPQGFSVEAGWARRTQ